MIKCGVESYACTFHNLKSVYTIYLCEEWGKGADSFVLRNMARLLNRRLNNFVATSIKLNKLST